MTAFVAFLEATLVEMGHHPEVLVGPETRLVEDLGLDSLDLLEVIVAVEDHYQVVCDVDRLVASGPVVTVAMLETCCVEGKK